MNCYKLDTNKNIIQCSLDEYNENDRMVDITYIGDIRISTVFLFFNHSIFDKEVQLFETMIFGGKSDGYQNRYSTWNDAIKGHKIAVDIVKLERAELRINKINKIIK
jgi:hypothetical protein